MEQPGQTPRDQGVAAIGLPATHTENSGTRKRVPNVELQSYTTVVKCSNRFGGGAGGFPSRKERKEYTQLGRGANRHILLPWKVPLPCFQRKESI